VFISSLFDHRYDAEQKMLKQQLLASIKTEAEQVSEQALYSDWLERDGAKLDTETKKDLQPLKRFWTDPNLNETDRFLRDYLTKQLWRGDDAPPPGMITLDPSKPKDKKKKSKPSAPKEEVNADVDKESPSAGEGEPALATVSDTEDEEELERQEDYERAFNFRFEEDNAATVCSESCHANNQFNH
jgi:protein KRI1